ncbi:ABC transporter permease (plasmid) [Salipiger sp. CCB-MM3]|uniref:amino acid ABC transporter permease n=1 Tax=Salipiger sp. CCB-MM3 TaxID=1792508 RepID=UPI00080AAC79|nr:amino acid ABC transporter permease [Salipiger sp. CCB-MM3]ANT63095.1 ABC transporter permease [Salipiger sp. CCB-MM3]
MSLDPSVIIDNLPLFMEGAGMTLRITAIAFVVGMTIGGFASLAALSRFAPLRWICSTYIAVMRGIPFIVLLFLIHYGLPAAGIRFPAIVNGTAALSLFAGAYYTEIIRACVQALPKGQWESARAIGMSPAAAAKDVIIPQILAPMVPPVVNCTMTMIKESSVISTITVAELTFSGLVVQGETFAPFEVFIAVALIYWAITAAFAFGATMFERRLAGASRNRLMTPLVSRYLVLDGRRT